MTDGGTKRLAALIAEEYPGTDFTTARLAMWDAVLGDVSDDEAFRALALHLRGPRCSFAPHPGELIERIRGREADAERLLDEEAELAVRLIEANVSDHEPVDLTPVPNAVVRAMGGPDAVTAAIAGDEWKYRREEARRLYKAYRRRGTYGAEAAPLVPAAVLESEGNRPTWRADPADFPARTPHAVPFDYRPIPGLPGP